MRKILIVLVMTALLSGCGTIAHKDVSTTWKGYGVTIEYDSRVAIDPADIPAFIQAVNKLEQLLRR